MDEAFGDPKDSSQNGAVSQDIIPLSKYFMPYGTVSPWVSRLLKILPDGFPIYEQNLEVSNPDGIFDLPSFSLSKPNDPSDNHQADLLEKFNNRLLEIEKVLLHASISNSQLKAEVEKYCLIADSERCEAEAGARFSDANQWKKCADVKQEALDVLRLLKKVVEYISPESKSSETPPMPKILALTPSIMTNQQSSDFRAETLILALSERWKKIKLFIQLLENARSNMKSSVFFHRVFLTIVTELAHIWAVKKIQYAPHLYSKGNDYPYRAQVIIDVFMPPVSIWGLEQPHKVDALFMLEGGPQSSEKANRVISPPYLNWPPFPAVPPTAPCSAEVFFVVEDSKTAPKERMDDQEGPHDLTEDQLKFKIRWLGEAATCIEERRILHVRIVVTSARPYELQPLKVDEASGVDLSALVRQKTELTASLLSAIPAMPAPLEFNPGWSPKTSELNARLQAAQWHLCDRAIHLIYQAQAARYKSVFDSVTNESLGASQLSLAILHEVGGQRRPLTVETRDQENNTMRREASLYENVTVERWDVYSTAISLQDLLIHRHSRPLFYADLEIWVEYRPSDSHSYSSASDHVAPKLSSKIAEHLKLFLLHLKILEGISASYLRHSFLEAWKFASHSTPRSHLDLIHLVPCPSPKYDGTNLFINFIDWVKNFLMYKVM